MPWGGSSTILWQWKLCVCTPFGRQCSGAGENCVDGAYQGRLTCVVRMQLIGIVVDSTILSLIYYTFHPHTAGCGYLDDLLKIIIYLHRMLRSNFINSTRPATADNRGKRKEQIWSRKLSATRPCCERPSSLTRRIRYDWLTLPFLIAYQIDMLNTYTRCDNRAPPTPTRYVASVCTYLGAPTAHIASFIYTTTT